MPELNPRTDRQCARCGKPNPAPAGDLPLEWEVFSSGERVVCEECITPQMMQRMDEEGESVEAKLSSCLRCGRKRHSDDIERDGWLMVEKGIVCPACVTEGDRRRDIRDLKEEAHRLREEFGGREDR